MIRPFVLPLVAHPSARLEAEEAEETEPPFFIPRALLTLACVESGFFLSISCISEYIQIHITKIEESKKMKYTQSEGDKPKYLIDDVCCLRNNLFA